MWWWVQVVLAVAIVGVLIVTYWEFLSDLLRYMLDHMGQAVILIFFYLIVYAQVTPLGLPYLFWNEFAERAHVGQLQDHSHRMGLLLAARTPS